MNSATFDENEWLWLCLTVRDSHVPLSQRFSIKDEVSALGLDLAVTLRLLKYDNEKEADRMRFQAKCMGAEIEEPQQEKSVIEW